MRFHRRLGPMVRNHRAGARSTISISSTSSRTATSPTPSVIVSRALPDVRDGLKPSQRRILVAMNDLGLGPTAVDQQVRRHRRRDDEALPPARRQRRSTRRWSAWPRTGTCGTGSSTAQGNFGSIAGLPPAAHRYTEARLSPVAAEMLARPRPRHRRFHRQLRRQVPRAARPAEQVPQPARQRLRRHRRRHGHRDSAAQPRAKSATASITLIDDPDVDRRRADGDHPRPRLPDRRHHLRPAGHPRRLPHRPRQDHPARPRRDHRGRQAAARSSSREVPFQQTRNRLAERSASWSRTSGSRASRDVRDESSARSGEPVRLVIDLKRDADPHLVLNQLYQFSPLQKTVSIIMWVLVDGRARCLPSRRCWRSSCATASRSSAGGPSTCCARPSAAATFSKGSSSPSPLEESSASAAPRRTGPRRSNGCRA